jgi:hypothetical protein
MINLNQIAIDNIKMLANFDKEKNFISFKDKIIIESKEKEENFENITELHDIEYALYFSFNHVLTLIKTKDIQKKYTRQELVKDMEDAIEKIFDVYNNVMYDDNNECIYNMLEHIDELIFRKKNDLKYYKAYYYMIDYFDYLCSGFTAFYDTSIKYQNMNMGITDSDSDSEKEITLNESLHRDDVNGYGYDNIDDTSSSEEGKKED